MNIKDYRKSIKDEICQLVVDIYLKQNNNIHPNFEDDEEYYIEPNELGLDINVSVDVNDTYVEGTYSDYINISMIIVPLDNNLILSTNNDDYFWDEFDTDTLSNILEMLKEYKNTM